MVDAVQDKRNQGRRSNAPSNRPVEEPEFAEQVVRINRVSKVVTGGRRFSLTAFVVVGDREGKVAWGKGKGKEVPDAIRKGMKSARRRLAPVVLKGATIPYAVTGEFCSAKVILKPASPGTGVIAGAAVRAVVEGDKSGVRPP